jgi:geranylgeranyl pyrophosphate synthase
VDDLLDFTASPETLGKPVLSDLAQGKVTLPLIFALERGGAAERTLVSTVLRERAFASVRPEQIAAFVRETGAVERARAVARDFALRAKSCLNGYGNSEYGRVLFSLPDFILERDN